jgi:hypothetical protein
VTYLGCKDSAQQWTYSYYTKAVLHATKEVAESTMKRAVGKLHNLKSNVVRMEFSKRLLYHATVPGKEGDSLRYMVVFPVISMETAKMLDVESLSEVCHSCMKFEANMIGLETEELKAEHALKCKTNYSGSAPAIEPEGAKRIFTNSVSSRKRQCDELFGDGDSKSFSVIENMQLAHVGA